MLQRDGIVHGIWGEWCCNPCEESPHPWIECQKPCPGMRRFPQIGAPFVEFHRWGASCCAVLVAVLWLVVRASRSSLSSLSGELLFVLVLLQFTQFSPLLRGRVSAHHEITPNTSGAHNHLTAAFKDRANFSKNFAAFLCIRSISPL